MPKALQDNYANYLAAASQPASGTGAFVGKGAGKSDPLGGLAATRLPLSTPATKLLAALSADSAGVPAFAAAWKMKPADLAQMLANPEAHKEFFNDALFHGTGTDYETSYPTYYNADGLTISNLTKAGAVSQLMDNFNSADGNPAAVKKDINAALAAINEPGTKLLNLSWTNNDDASFNGVFAFNATTGQIKAVGSYIEP